MKKITFVLIGILLLANISFAQTEEDHIGKFGIGLGFTLQPLEETTDFFPGAHVRLRFNETIALQGEITIRSQETSFTVADITSQPLSFSLLYFLLPKSLVSVYLIGGITFTKPSVEYTDIVGPEEEEGEWEQGIFGGFGLEIPVNGSLVIFAEIRYNDLDFTITDFDVDYSGLSYSAGITFYF
ncbi:MAG: outer membrane beta-barrel protein [Acidobacteria bacterium]|nr:outer membrane beta-barrel protein [Acidobacteriota bacterium]